MFGVCRQAILNAQDQSISLISLMPGLSVPVSQSETVSEDTVAPLFFGVALQWLVQPEDQGKQFEHRFQIVKPDGNIYPMSTSTVVAEKNNVSVVLQGMGFPVGVPGVYHVTVDLRESGQSQEWQKFGEYPIEVFHVTQEEALIAPI